MSSFDSAFQAPPTRKTEEQFRKELDALNAEASQLNEQRIRIQAEIERARSEKEELEAKMLEEFKTSDLNELSDILERAERENEEALRSYRKSIEALRSEIDTVSQQLAKIR